MTPEETARKARSLDDKAYAECFNVFKKISTEWAAIQDWLKNDFLGSLGDRTGVKVLSVGSGTGDFDLSLMKILAGKMPQVAYTALDPNREHNRLFRQRYDEGEFRVHSFEIVAAPFGREAIPGFFDIIHLTHCLYYIPDRREAIACAFERLAENGVLLIFHQTPLGINEVQKAFLKRVKGHEEEMFSTYDIKKILDDLAISYRQDIVVADLDVTDCVEDNENGRKLLSFLLESHSEQIDPSLKEEIIAFIKETCRRVEGRYLLFHPVGIFRIDKSRRFHDGLLN